MGNFDFGYFPKMLETWEILMVVKNAQAKIIVIFFGEMMPLVHMNALFKNRGWESRKKSRKVTLIWNWMHCDARAVKIWWCINVLTYIPSNCTFQL